MAEINKELLNHLAKLSRLELTDQEKDRFLDDLDTILDHFKELQELKTDTVPPMTGGTQLKNVFRQDDERDSSTEKNERENVTKSFPESDKRFLKVPQIFSDS